MTHYTFTVGDKDYKLRLTARACCELEKKLGTNPINVLLAVANSEQIPQLDTMITILHYSMTALNHGITINEVYNIYDSFVDEGNTLVDLIPIILEVFKVSGFFKEEQEKN